MAVGLDCMYMKNSPPIAASSTMYLHITMQLVSDCMHAGNTAIL